MTTDEARELIIDGINYAAYRETDSSLHDSDKNRLFGSEHYKSDRPSPSLVHGQKATSKRRWLCYSAGPTRLTVPFLRFRMHKAFSNARIRFLGHVIRRAKRLN